MLERGSSTGQSTGARAEIDRAEQVQKMVILFRNLVVAFFALLYVVSTVGALFNGAKMSIIWQNLIFVGIAYVMAFVVFKYFSKPIATIIVWVKNLF